MQRSRGLLPDSGPALFGVFIKADRHDITLKASYQDGFDAVKVFHSHPSAKQLAPWFSYLSHPPNARTLCRPEEM
jgi:hypothetical protein